MFEPWFVWALIGITCIGLELLVPGFVIFFFGMGGLATALFSLIPGIYGMVWLQVILFLVFSTAALIFLRRHFTRIFEGTVFDQNRGRPEEDGAGELGELTEPAGPVREGRVRFRGTTWKARTLAEELPAGSLVRIVRREGLTYIIEPSGGSAGQKGEK